jgi:hypothetical protein
MTLILTAGTELRNHARPVAEGRTSCPAACTDELMQLKRRISSVMLATVSLHDKEV